MNITGIKNTTNITNYFTYAFKSSIHYIKIHPKSNGRKADKGVNREKKFVFVKISYCFYICVKV